MADAGLPIEHVADQLGHKDLRMLQQHYRHRIKPTIGGAHILDGVLGATHRHRVIQRRCSTPIRERYATTQLFSVRRHDRQHGSAFPQP